MIKKTTLIMMLLSINTFAVDLVYPNGKKETFLELKNYKSLNHNKRVYIKKGHRFYDTGAICISFGREEDIEAFAKKYGLEFIKFTNRALYTALFALNDNRDIIKLCSLINRDENIRYAKPDWKRERLLK